MTQISQYGVFRAITLLLALLLVGCGGALDIESRGVVIAADVDPVRWSREAIISIPNADTLSRRDITLFVKHQPQEQLNSIELWVRTTAPDRATHLDRITIPLHNNERGRRGGAKVNRQPYRSEVVWGQAGEYTIEITPIRPIKGVEAVGVEIQ